ncbi:MAG TPA: NAD(P)H-binding protein [Saprospiraceae bacterium]|nr:NAD(P)H-binding protein [Saprospiraceae bacterium]
MTNQNKTALIIGASGLVGGHLMQQLLAHPAYREVVALVRRPLDINHPKLRQEILDFDHPDPEKIQGDELFCALGTTIKKAGSKEVQHRIDGIYPYEIGRIARQQGVRGYFLVSSVGTDAKSSTFYLRVKGELEEKLKMLGFPSLVIVRPSFLLGNRTEFRLGEKIGIFLAQLLRPIIPKRYRGVQASAVAAALVAAANRNMEGVMVLENEEI